MHDISSLKFYYGNAQTCANTENYNETCPSTKYQSSATFINVLSITASILFLTQSNFGGIHEGIEDVVL